MKFELFFFLSLSDELKKGFVMSALVYSIPHLHFHFRNENLGNIATCIETIALNNCTEQFSC